MLTPEELAWRQERLENIRQWSASCKYEEFIDDAKIWQTIESHQTPDKQEVLDVIAKARNNAKTGAMLSPDDTAVLVNTTDPELIQAIFETATAIKETVYGNRIVLFAPLYLSSACVNNCTYCGFRECNGEVGKQVLTPQEIQVETEVLTEMGHKRLIAVYGEHPSSDADYICQSVEKIYATQSGSNEIRRANINAAPMFVDEFRRIKETGIGTYQIFQETYHHELFGKVHPKNTLKGDYKWRQFGLHRALEAGIDDVATGMLVGLYDWRFDLLGMLHHAMSLEKNFGIGPHTMSYPRLEPALNTPLASQSKYLVSDEDFLKMVAIIRLMCPYTGSILTAREKPAIRREALGKCGISQMDAGTRIGLGGYAELKKENTMEKQQFFINDSRSLDDFIYALCEDGYLPSFCTAGYREGRTGANFMPLAKNASVNHFCIPNGVCTFKEYLLDYASPKVQKIGNEVIIPKYLKLAKERYGNIYDKLTAKLKQAEAQERDMHF
jgi:2-iminoacetate synthase